MWWKIGAGTHVAAHSHPHEQLVWVVKGRMDFRIDKERRVLEAGGIATIPGGVEHEGYCHEDTEVIDIFAPPREDFLAANRRGFRVASQGGRYACFEKMAFCAFACRYRRGGGIIGFDAMCSTSTGQSFGHRHLCHEGFDADYQ